MPVAFGAFTLERGSRPGDSRVPGRPSRRDDIRRPDREGQANTLRRKLRSPSVKKTTLKATMAG